MNNRGSESTLRAAKRAVLGAIAIFVVTTVHHVYGAYLYNTPWRLHAAVISGLATALISASLWLFRRHPGDAVGVVTYWVFIVVTLLVPFLCFGVFEGAYNHALKDALYFAHASPELMTRMFPPPTYELPNNAFFEVTGVMHVIPGFMTGYYIYRFFREEKRLRGTPAKHRAVGAA